MSNYTLFADRPVERYRKTDLLFIISVLLLWGLGLFTLYICTPNAASRLFDDKYYFVTRQLLWSIGGFAGLLVFAFVPVKVIKKFLPVIVIATLVMCLLTLIPGIGSERKGASRWIRIGAFTFQPSEMAKFSVVLFLANLFDKNNSIEDNDDAERNYVYPLIGLALFVIIIFMQKDFSTGVFVFIVGSIMFFVTGSGMGWFLPLMLLVIPAAALMLALEPYRLMRVVAFFHPEDFTLTTGYQQFASQRAITAGGFWGTGFGSGMSLVNSIPEVQTDYIFAGWANSMGFLGVTIYFVLISIFAWRGFSIALKSPNKFASYAAFGCTLSIVLQSLVNCAVVCGAIPTTGIPLPFFSSGGSSLIFTMCMCGFIINTSHCEADSSGDEEDKDSYDIVDNKVDNISEWGKESE